jgi:hypothetical protein
MTRLLHRFPEDSGFDQKVQRAELEFLARSVSARNDRALFLHRLWRRFPRNASLRRHARPIRRAGTSQLAAWALSFGTCGLACLAGAAATMLLPRNIWQR